MEQQVTTSSARLVINQNLTGPRPYIALAGTNPEGPDCPSVTDANGVGHRGLLVCSHLHRRKRTCEPLIIRSEGTAPLVIHSIEIDGPDAESFNQTSDCIAKELVAKAACTVQVKYVSSGTPTTGSARLIISQNLDGPATFVPLTGPHTDTKPDFTLSTTTKCSLVPSSQPNGGGRLTIAVA